MGGLGPGIGGMELIVVAIVALLVVGPKDLPLMMRKVGRAMGKARAMANEFRASFDEMARQSELDELRKEVEALRTNQGIHRLGADADAAFKEIRADLNSDLKPASAPALTSPEGWSEVDQPKPAPTPPPVIEAAPKPEAVARTEPAPRRKAAAKSVAGTAAKAKSAPKTKAKPKAAATKTPAKPAAKPRAPRKAPARKASS